MRKNSSRWALALGVAALLLTGAPAVAQHGGGGGHGGGGEGGGACAGDVLGDLIHVLRAETGQPILARRFVELPREVPGYGWGYCPIAVDANGDEIGFLPFSCDVADPDAAVEVDYFGRLSGGRTKEKNQRMHFDEVISTIQMAGVVKQEPATGRLMMGFDCSDNGGGQALCDEWSAIDSPMENMSLYLRLMKYGHLQTDPEEIDIWWHGDPAQSQPVHPALRPEDWPKFHPSVRHLLPGGGAAACWDAAGNFDPLCAGTEPLGERDFVRAGALLGAAANKTGIITVDLVQYMNRILKITLDTETTTATLATLPALVRDCEDPAVAYLPPDEDDPAPVDPPYLPLAQCTTFDAYDGLENYDDFYEVGELFVDFGAAFYDRLDWREESFPELILATGDGSTFQIEFDVELLPWLAWVNGPDAEFPELYEATFDVDAFVESASDSLRAIEYIHNYAVPEDLWSVYPSQ